MPTVLDWNPTVDPSELVRVIREAVAGGAVVVLPGDCGYVALVNPAHANAAAQLAALGEAPAVLAWGADDPKGLSLPVSILGRRLMFRGWPAPLTVAVGGEPDWPSDWSPAVRERLTATGPVRFRCPEHPLFEATVPALDLPVLVVDTFLPTVEAALELANDSDGIAVSVGELAVEGKPTVVTLSGSGYEVTQPGLFPSDEIERFVSRIVLFVCTGNTCRSPLAEALAKKLLADRLDCPPDELARRGVWVLSAGVATHGGGVAAEEAVAVAGEFGANLSDHQSRPVNPELLAAADQVITMTRGHAQALATRYPGIGPVPQLLCGTADLDDPIGAGVEVYRGCARTIVAHLERFLPEWVGQ